MDPTQKDLDKIVEMIRSDPKLMAMAQGEGIARQLIKKHAYTAALLRMEQKLDAILEFLNERSDSSNPAGT